PQNPRCGDPLKNGRTLGLRKKFLRLFRFFILLAGFLVLFPEKAQETFLSNRSGFSLFRNNLFF
ncbi:TPA: hypothetical protein DCS99_05075, partial [Candidatus Wolfebacteria bacterium]|nr:hypothetical protein [Candidatus Wolfebacteria bacterium]